MMSSAVVDIELVRSVCGSTEAMENICADNGAFYNLKKTAVATSYLEMANRIRDEYTRKFHKELNPGVSSVGAQMVGQYLEACQKAGSIDLDDVMNEIRGGTFETFGGRYRLSGKERYGADVCFGYPVGISLLKKENEQYLTEYPCVDVDKPIIETD